MQRPYTCWPTNVHSRRIRFLPSTMARVGLVDANNRINAMLLHLTASKPIRMSLPTLATQYCGAMARIGPADANSRIKATPLQLLENKPSRMSLLVPAIRLLCDSVARLWPVGAMARVSATPLRLMVSCKAMGSATLLRWMASCDSRKSLQESITLGSCEALARIGHVNVSSRFNATFLF